MTKRIILLAFAVALATSFAGFKASSARTSGASAHYVAGPHEGSDD